MEDREDSWGHLWGTCVTLGCFPVEEESPRSQVSRFFCNNGVQSGKHAPSVNSVMQKRKQLKQIVSLWQHIVTAVTQLYRKAQAEQHGEVTARIINYSSNTFFVDKMGPIHLKLFKLTSPAVPVRHRSARSSSGTRWPVEETDFLPSCVFSDGSGHLHCSLVTTGGKDAVFSLETLMTSSKPNTIFTNYFILFTVAKSMKWQRKTAHKGAFTTSGKYEI